MANVPNKPPISDYISSLLGSPKGGGDQKGEFYMTVSLSTIISLVRADPSGYEPFIRIITQHVRSLFQTYLEAHSIRHVESTDHELEIVLAFKLCQMYRGSPPLRIAHLDFLLDILGKMRGEKFGGARFNVEIAMTQVAKCAVVLDILTALFRRDPANITGVLFPQYLPVRSDMVIIDSSGNLSIKTEKDEKFKSPRLNEHIDKTNIVFPQSSHPKRVHSVPSAIAPIVVPGKSENQTLFTLTSSEGSAFSRVNQSLGVSTVNNPSTSNDINSSLYPRNKNRIERVYGKSWVAWDHLIASVLPSFELYTFQELEGFFKEEDMIEAINDTPTFTLESAIRELRKAVSLLDEAKLREHMLIILQLLSAFYSAMNDYQGIKEMCMGIGMKAVGSLIQDSIDGRLHWTFYRVGLYGPMFKEERAMNTQEDAEDGVEFIVREGVSHYIGDMKAKLVEKYGKRFGVVPKVIQSMGDVKIEGEDCNVPVVQLTAVKPYFDVIDEDNRRTEFMRRTGIKYFYCDETYLPENMPQNKKQEAQLHDHYLRRYIFETENVFPFCVSYISVKKLNKDVKREDLIINTEGVNSIRYNKKGHLIIEIRPAQRGAAIIQKRTDDLIAVIEPFDEKNLQLLLQGAIAPQVNAGVLAIYNSFLLDNRDLTSDEDKEYLLDKFNVFFSVCRIGLLKLIELRQVEVEKSGRKNKYDYIPTYIEKFHELLDSVDPSFKEQHMLNEDENGAWA
jgi:hypothetical protein